MQQQAALMAAAQGGTAAYINPMAALAATQMQHVNPLAGVPNGLSSAAITPTTTGNDYSALWLLILMLLPYACVHECGRLCTCWS